MSSSLKQSKEICPFETLFVISAPPKRFHQAPKPYWSTNPDTDPSHVSNKGWKQVNIFVHDNNFRKMNLRAVNFVSIFISSEKSKQIQRMSNSSKNENWDIFWLCTKVYFDFIWRQISVNQKKAIYLIFPSNQDLVNLWHFEEKHD